MKDEAKQPVQPGGEPVQSEAVANAKPAKEPVVQAPDDSNEEVKAVDRSAYNCPNCGGSGLQDQETICSKCTGTGKV